MSWVAVGSAVAGAAVSSSMSKGGGGGGSTQTVSKDPWAAAAPWLTQNLQTGQDLQGYYQQNPFNPIQQAAYGNLFRSNDYINNAIPGLLGQMSQSQGFDRSNPHARPQAMQFPTMGVGPTGVNQDMSGLLGAGVMHTQNPFSNGLMPTTQPAAPAVAGFDPQKWLNGGGFDPSGGGGGGA